MAASNRVLSQRAIFAFWFPLAASWLLMSCEGPILQALIARLPDLQVQLAAFGIVVSLEIAIESPVIMLLATSTALATNAHNYRVLRRFMIGINTLVTAAAVLFAFTPVFDLVVRRLMGIPESIAAAARPGMMIMTFWSAAIGFRRFLQGVLIRHGQTRWVGYGTASRLVAGAGSGVVLAWAGSLSGVCVGSVALMAGVLTEAAFVAAVARPTVRRLRATPDGEAVTLRDVARFHMPLAAASLLNLLAQPLIGAGLARMPHPRETLAAWPVIWGILFVFRAPTFSLPEAIIALAGEPRHRGPLRDFCRNVGTACSVALGFLAGTPLIGAYLRIFAGLPESIGNFVRPALLLSAVLPFISAWHSWYRGLLMSARLTRDVYWGMGINLGFLALLLSAGALFQAPGVETAAVSLALALVVEIAFLGNRLPDKRARKT